ncbi:hypothetical protein V5O48_005833 [Marasmius crinis-equi]|uniref:HMG box domain-containing protein n=1 Tax=Marasmius crinis-equi TaxID=585013 RepID=A0ABR3FLE1_9AGAR
MPKRRKSAQNSTQAPDANGGTITSGTTNDDKNPSSTKKARGRETWAKGEKLELLLNYKEMFEKHPGAMYEQLTQEFIRRWGYDLDPDEAPDPGKVYVTKDINEFTGEERVAEEERRAQFKDTLRDKIGNAARYRWREKEKRADSQGMSMLLKSILNVLSDPPKKPVERQYYQKVYYPTRLKPGFDEYWKGRSKAAGDEKCRIKETNEYCDARWAKESEDFKAAMRKEMNENYAKEMKDHKDRMKWKDDAESYAKVWAKAPNLLPTIVLALAKVFGSGCSIFLYGPRADGEITVDSVSATIPGAISRKDLSEFCPEVNARMHATCQQFAEALFSKEYCKSRKVGEEVPTASFEGECNEAVGNIYRSVTGEQPVAISGPSLPTTCDVSPPSGSLNGNLAQVATSSPSAPLSSTPAPFSTANSSLHLPNGTFVNDDPTQMKCMTEGEWNSFFSKNGLPPHEQQSTGMVRNTEGLMMGPGAPGNQGIRGMNTLEHNQSFSQSFDSAILPPADGFPQFPSEPQTFSIAGQSFNLGTRTTNHDNDNFPSTSKYSTSNNHGYNDAAQHLTDASLMSPLRLSGDRRRQEAFNHQTGGTTDTNALRSPVHAHGAKDSDIPMSELPLQHHAYIEKPISSGKENRPIKRKSLDTEPITNTPPKRRRAKEVAPADEDVSGDDDGDAGPGAEADDETVDDLDLSVADRRATRNKVCPTKFSAGGPGTFGYPDTKTTSARASTTKASTKTKKASTKKASAKKAPAKKASTPTTAKKGGAAVGGKSARRGQKAARGNVTPVEEIPAAKKNARKR